MFWRTCAVLNLQLVFMITLSSRAEGALSVNSGFIKVKNRASVPSGSGISVVDQPDFKRSPVQCGTRCTGAVGCQGFVFSPTNCNQTALRIISGTGSCKLVSVIDPNGVAMIANDYGCENLYVKDQCNKGSGPCMNGGQCDNNLWPAICVCTVNYTGQFCETPVWPMNLIRNVNYTGNCSFPYTHNGTVFYKCTSVPGLFSLCSTACRAVNGTGICCSGQPNFVAQFASVNVIGVTNQTNTVSKSVFGWVFFMQRTDTADIWNWNWNNYKIGFGSLASCYYWLGLERVHQMTSWYPYRLRVEIQSTNGSWVSEEYWSFYVGDETVTRYTLQVSGDSGDAGGALMSQNGFNFSTYDSNHFPAGRSSASYFKGGWWFNPLATGCATCSVNGGFMWGTLPPAAYNLQAVRMMMKPK